MGRSQWVNTARLGRMAHPDPGVLGWASAVLGGEVAVVRGLRLGGSPWLLRASDRDVVLRVAAAERAREAETEVAAMTHAARAADFRLPVAVAALASPPDMGWFPDSMAAQGRPDLTREVMLDRRDAFLAAALSQLETVG
jgi:hypothetical protein